MLIVIIARITTSTTNMRQARYLSRQENKNVWLVRCCKMGLSQQTRKSRAPLTQQERRQFVNAAPGH